MTLTEDEMTAYFSGKVAKWWIPEQIRFVDELPHTATGKLLKSRIRELYC
jgi:acyl-CoA synthetase (AMP-forming)/AMP-acid ligase II